MSRFSVLVVGVFVGAVLSISGAANTNGTGGDAPTIRATDQTSDCWPDPNKLVERLQCKLTEVHIATSGDARFSCDIRNVSDSPAELYPDLLQRALANGVRFHSCDASVTYHSDLVQKALDIRMLPEDICRTTPVDRGSTLHVTFVLPAASDLFALRYIPVDADFCDMPPVSHLPPGRYLVDAALTVFAGSADDPKTFTRGDLVWSTNKLRLQIGGAAT